MKRSALTQMPNALRMSPSGDAVGGAVLPGYSALPSTFTLNSVTPTPTFIFRGKEATLGGWPSFAGGVTTLTLDSSGTDPSVAVASPFPDPTDTVVQFAGATPGRAFSAGSTSYGDIATGDFVYEIILMTPGGAAGGIVSKKTSVTTGSNGWRVNAVAGPFRVNTFNRSGFNIQNQTVGALFTNGQYHHLMGFGDRSGDLRVYIDGVLGLTGSIAGQDGLSLAGTDVFRIGGFSAGTESSAIVIAWAALWEAAGLCSGATADQDALALSRFLALGL